MNADYHYILNDDLIKMGSMEKNENVDLIILCNVVINTKYIHNP